MQITYRRPGRRVRFTRRTTLLTIAALLALVGSAVAAWIILATGEGPAGGRFAENTPITVDVTAVPAPAGEGGRPGDTVDAFAHVSNPTQQTLYITSTEPKSGDSGFTAGCPIENVTSNTLSGLAVPVAPGGADVALPGQWTMSPDAPSECAGLEFTAGVKLTLTSQHP